MFAWKRPRLGLLFVGGTALSGSAILSHGIREAAEVRPWMTAAGEINMIADLDPIFISPLGTTATPAIWEKIATVIHEHGDEYDGIVVLHEPTTAAMTAIALSAIVQSTGIPIVITPGREHGEEGGRANLINALQTATIDLAGVVFLDGVKIFHAASLTNSRLGLDGHVIGRIDFGIRLSKHEKRSTKVLRLIRHLEPRVAIVSFPPFGSPLIPPRVRGVVFSLDPLAPPSDASWRAVRIPSNVAVVVVGGPAPKVPPNILTIMSPARTAAIQLMVALGERPHAWRTTLKSMNSSPT